MESGGIVVPRTDEDHDGLARIHGAPEQQVIGAGYGTAFGNGQDSIPGALRAAAVEVI